MHYFQSPLDYGLGCGDGYRKSFALDANARFVNHRCNAFVIKVPYFYIIPNLQSNFVRESPLLIDLRDAEDNLRFCEGIFNTFFSLFFNLCSKNFDKK